MTDRELTPEERARLAEFSAVFEADLRTKFQRGPVSPAELKAALVEIASTLDPPIDPPIVEIRDNGRFEVFIPLSWFK